MHKFTNTRGSSVAVVLYQSLVSILVLTTISRVTQLTATTGEMTRLGSRTVRTLEMYDKISLRGEKEIMSSQIIILLVDTAS